MTSNVKPGSRMKILSVPLHSVWYSMICAFGKQIDMVSYYKYFTFLHINAGEYEVTGPQGDFPFHAKPQRLLHDQKKLQL